MPNQRSLAVVLVVVGFAVAAVVAYRDELGASGSSRAAAPSDPAVAFYTCSMDPSVESPHPGSCPICGMALTPVTKAERASGVVQLSAQQKFRSGILVASVVRRALPRQVQGTGVVVAGAVAQRPWIDARIFRGDPEVAISARAATVTFADLPLAQFTGKIVTAAPLRIEVEDLEGQLSAGMFADVRIDDDLPAQLVVPASAVLYAGKRRVVWLDRGKYRYEPKQVKIGAQVAGFVQVLDGLAEGDQVLTAGTFLLTAESRLRSPEERWADPPPGPPRKRVVNEREGIAGDKLVSRPIAAPSAQAAGSAAAGSGSAAAGSGSAAAGSAGSGAPHAEHDHAEHDHEKHAGSGSGGAP